MEFSIKLKFSTIVFFLATGSKKAGKQIPKIKLFTYYANRRNETFFEFVLSTAFNNVLSCFIWKNYARSRIFVDNFRT